MAGNPVVLKIAADTKGIRRGAREANRSLTSIEKSSNKTSAALKRISHYGAGAFAIFKSAQFVSQSIAAFRQQQQAISLTENAISSMGRTTHGLTTRMRAPRCQAQKPHHASRRRCAQKRRS